MTGSKKENCDEKKRSIARRRWKILAEALQRSNSRDASPDSASTRKFQSFGLLVYEPLGQDFYSVKCISSELKVTIREPWGYSALQDPDVLNNQYKSSSAGEKETGDESKY
ncbi:hypothetical protein SK128_006804 [Halocaridina rubra]|uniref:Uncharacterized protein n=1 Tax=Halocaridina rubra TaxID=373956 RepID=A0AAN9A983_HALRR